MTARGCVCVSGRGRDKHYKRRLTVRLISVQVQQRWMQFVTQRMKQAVEAMKSSHADVLNKQDRSDLNRSRGSARWELNVTESKPLEISVQRIDRPPAANIKMRSSMYLQAAAKLAVTAHPLTRPKGLKGWSKPRQTSVLLPPISRSNAIPSNVDRAAALPPQRKKSAIPKGYGTRISTGNVMMENTMFHLLVTQCGKANQESNMNNKISAAVAAGNRAAFIDPESRSRLIKRSFDGQPAAKLTPALVEPPVRQKKNDSCDPGASHSSTMAAVKVKHDASLCEARQQRGCFCSSDSAIETESEGSEGKGHTEWLKDTDDDEYYTDQRITEWVLEVNDSLFPTGNDELKSSKPAEEQDVATIKIIYTGY